jgi:hypothetical protein
MISGQQSFYGPLQCHWDCQEATRAKMGEENAQDLINLRVNRRLAQDGIVPGHHLFVALGGTI